MAAFVTSGLLPPRLLRRVAILLMFTLNFVMLLFYSKSEGTTANNGQDEKVGDRLKWFVSLFLVTYNNIYLFCFAYQSYKFLFQYIIGIKSGECHIFYIIPIVVGGISGIL